MKPLWQRGGGRWVTGPSLPQRSPISPRLLLVGFLGRNMFNNFVFTLRISSCLDLRRKIVKNKKQKKIEKRYILYYSAFKPFEKCVKLCYFYNFCNPMCCPYLAILRLRCSLYSGGWRSSLGVGLLLVSVHIFAATLDPCPPKLCKSVVRYTQRSRAIWISLNSHANLSKLP